MEDAIASAVFVDKASRTTWLDVDAFEDAALIVYCPLMGDDARKGRLLQLAASLPPEAEVSVGTNGLTVTEARIFLEGAESLLQLTALAGEVGEEGVDRRGRRHHAETAHRFEEREEALVGPELAARRQQQIERARVLRAASGKWGESQRWLGRVHRARGYGAWWAAARAPACGPRRA